MILCTCIAFSSTCRIFISTIVLIFFGSDIVFYRFFNYVITACTLSSLPYRSFKLPSSKSYVHSWPLFSNNYVILCIVCAIFSADYIAPFSHCALTSRVVMGTMHSSNSLIWSLYCSNPVLFSSYSLHKILPLALCYLGWFEILH